MSVIRRPSGLVQRSRFAGDSTWVMMCSARCRVSRGGRDGMSPGKNAAVTGSVASQPCWRIACRNALTDVMASVRAPCPIAWLASQAR